MLVQSIISWWGQGLVTINCLLTVSLVLEQLHTWGKDCHEDRLKA